MFPVCCIIYNVHMGVGTFSPCCLLFKGSFGTHILASFSQETLFKEINLAPLNWCFFPRFFFFFVVKNHPLTKHLKRISSHLWEGFVCTIHTKCIVGYSFFRSIFWSKKPFIVLIRLGVILLAGKADHIL